MAFKADLNVDFDSGDDFGAVPAGKYSVVVKRAEERQTKAGNGTYINLGLEITGPEYAGRWLWDMAATDHPSEKWVETGRKKLSQLCVAGRLRGFRSCTELEGIEARAEVSVDREDSTRNKVWGYAPLNTPAGQSKAAKGARKRAEEKLGTPASGMSQDFDDDDLPF